MALFEEMVGAIDEGTSSARFLIFDAKTLKLICYHQEDIIRIYPQQGWVEQNPEQILTAVLSCIENAVKKLDSLGGNASNIISIGITNQRETTIVWDKVTGKPLYNAIVWSDMRTSSTVNQLLDKIPNRSRNKNYLRPLCGLPFSPYFSSLKLCWLIDTVSVVSQAIKNRTCLFGTVDSWLIWNLTGGIDGGLHITDVTNASRTMLMNIERLEWDSHLLNFFGISSDILPTIRSSSELYGTIKGTVLNGVPITGCLGDQQSALLGQFCTSVGQVKITYGTGCFLLMNTGHKIVDSCQGLLSTVAYQLGPNASPVYALEGSIAVAGSAINWLRDNLNLIENVESINELTQKVNSSGDVYFVPAFSGLYAPYWNQEARGIICGINDDTKSEHIVYACLEAICFQIRDILEAMKSDYGNSLTQLNVDGGVSKNDFIMQMQADIVGLNVLRPEMAETTAL